MIITKTHVLQVLSRHVGRSKGITIVNLVRDVLALNDANTHANREPRGSAENYQRAVRHRVTELRTEGHHVCAHPTSGYYMAADADELNECCKFLTDRAMCGLRQVAAMKRVSVPDLYGQLNLPT